MLNFNSIRYLSNYLINNLWNTGSHCNYLISNLNISNHGNSARKKHMETPQIGLLIFMIFHSFDLIVYRVFHLLRVLYNTAL